jgi:hypothetical protein
MSDAWSEEKQARVRWGAWWTARHLRLGAPRWLDRVGGSDEPPTVRVDLAWGFRGDEMERVRERFTEVLVASLGAEAAKLDGRLFVVDDEQWWVWRGKALVIAEQGAGERRSVGAVVLAVGSHAGQTLDAVGVDLRPGMPGTVEELFARVHEGAKPVERAALSYACGALEDGWKHSVRVCLHHDLAELATKPPRDAWWDLVLAMKPTVSPTPPAGRLTKRAVVQAVWGVPATTTGVVTTTTGVVTTTTGVVTTALTGFPKWLQ